MNAIKGNYSTWETNTIGIKAHLDWSVYCKLMITGLRIRFDKRQTTPVRMGWDSDYKKTTKENQDIKSR